VTFRSVRQHADSDQANVRSRLGDLNPRPEAVSTVAPHPPVSRVAQLNGYIAAMAEATHPSGFSMSGGEFETLHGALERIRSTFAWKCGGLDAEAMRVKLPPSSLTLGGLLKHMALVEDDLFSWTLLGRELPAVWSAADGDVFEWAWRSAADDSPIELMSLWHQAVARSRSALAEALAVAGLDRITAHELSGARLNVRRLLVDANEEYSRHTGHADLIREAVDGLTGDKPPQ
jgi:hypothetical protein